MTDLNEKRFKQLGLFSVIVGELVVMPGSLGGLTYFLLKGKEIQIPLTLIAALAGFCLAMYRIYQRAKQLNEDKD